MKLTPEAADAMASALAPPSVMPITGAIQGGGDIAAGTGNLTPDGGTRFYNDTSQQEAPPPDHEPPADQLCGDITPIPSDEILEAETDEGIVMLMVAHGVGPQADDREHAIEMLKAHRNNAYTDVDKAFNPSVLDGDGILSVLAEGAEAVVREAAGPSTRWDPHQQKHVTA